MNIKVRKWTDEPCCPKCLRTRGKQMDGIAYSVVDGVDVQFMCCKRCGFSWLMHAAYKDWKEFDTDAN